MMEYEDARRELAEITPHLHRPLTRKEVNLYRMTKKEVFFALSTHHTELMLDADGVAIGFIVDKIDENNPYNGIQCLRNLTGWYGNPFLSLSPEDSLLISALELSDRYLVCPPLCWVDEYIAQARQ